MAIPISGEGPVTAQPASRAMTQVFENDQLKRITFGFCNPNDLARLGACCHRLKTFSADFINLQLSMRTKMDIDFLRGCSGVLRVPFGDVPNRANHLEEVDLLDATAAECALVLNANC